MKTKKVLLIGYGSIGKRHSKNLMELKIKPYVLTKYPDMSNAVFLKDVNEAFSQLVLASKIFLLFRFRALSAFLIRPVLNCWTASNEMKNDYSIMFDLKDKTVMIAGKRGLIC